MLDTKSVYQLKVAIREVTPPIWRRLLLPSYATFWELHIAIQDSFGWTDSHLHEFFIGPAWDRAVPRIRIPHPEDDVFGEEKEPLDESKIRLSDFLSEKRPKATYIYDFGDNWNHQIMLENVLLFDPKEIYPRVLAGKRACAWEDSGGPWGYMEKIKILKNKKHPEFREIADWLEIDDIEELDLEFFDSDDVIFRNPATELRRTQKGIDREFS